MDTRGFWHLSVIVVLTGTIFLENNTARAQYTGSFQTNIISAVASNWVSGSGYLVGSNTAYDVLLIRNGGVLSNGFGSIGYYTRGSNNLAVVSGSGSVWYNQSDLMVGRYGKNNSLVISNQGQVFNDNGYVGYAATYSSNNSVLVTGNGSVWSNRFDLLIGRSGTASSMVISDHAQVFNRSGFVGYNVRSTDRAVVTGGGVWSNSLDLYIGYRGAGNTLVISDQGKVFDRSGFVGNGSGSVSSSNNSVLVTGSGSVWNNQADLIVGEFAKNNSLVISNQGQVFSGNGYVGYNYTTTNTSVLVTGSGSVWSNRLDLFVGWSGTLASLVISNQGQVFDNSSVIGFSDSATYDSVLVTGIGSLWINRATLYVAHAGVSNSLTITDGASVIASNAFIGLFSPPDAGNRLEVSGGGSLYVTNRLASGELNVLSGTLALNSGTVTVDSLVATNGSNGKVSFSGGALNTKGTTVNNGSVFNVGNGTSTAVLTLDKGGSGYHLFTDGLAIASNGTLRGIGTLIGDVTVKGGGTLSPGYSPGSMTFSNNLTLAPNSVFAVELDGNGVGQYDQIIVLGTVSVSNSVLRLALGFTPVQGYLFTIVSNLGPSVVLGTFVDPQGDVLTNNAMFVVDGWTFQIHYDYNPDGQDVVLTAVVPEPSTLLLVALGSVGLIGLRRRLRRGR